MKRLVTAHRLTPTDKPLAVGDVIKKDGTTYRVAVVQPPRLAPVVKGLAYEPGDRVQVIGLEPLRRGAE